MRKHAGADVFAFDFATDSAGIDVPAGGSVSGFEIEKRLLPASSDRVAGGSLPSTGDRPLVPSGGLGADRPRPAPHPTRERLRGPQALQKKLILPVVPSFWTLLAYSPSFWRSRTSISWLTGWRFHTLISPSWWWWSIFCERRDQWRVRSRGGECSLPGMLPLQVPLLAQLGMVQKADSLRECFGVAEIAGASLGLDLDELDSDPAGSAV